MRGHVPRITVYTRRERLPVLYVMTGQIVRRIAATTSLAPLLRSPPTSIRLVTNGAANKKGQATAISEVMGEPVLNVLR